MPGRRLGHISLALLAGIGLLAVQLGAAAPAARAAVPRYTSISTSGSHTCAVTGAGGVECWGDNQWGELGNGATGGYSAVPVPVSGLSSGVIAVSAGGNDTCAVTSAGGAWCWGTNNAGQLGDGTYTNRSVPVSVSGLSSGVAAISTGGGQGHTCAVTSSGGAWCWGDDTWGELGDNGAAVGDVPVPVSGLSSGVVAISAGFTHSCAVTSAGGAWCWGSDNTGQLGDGQSGPLLKSSVPVAVVGLSSGVTAISAGPATNGGSYTCAIATAGGLWCWGYNFDGELGDETYDSSSVPVAVTGLSSGVSAISAGWSHPCALTSGGAKCWGDNTYGELGDGTYTPSPVPVAVTGLSSGVSVISAGGGATCAVTGAGGAWCWGLNAYGELGDGTLTNSPVPVAVVARATYVALTPTRLLDTRTGNGLSGPFQNSVARTFQVTGRGGVPSSASAVTGNLTVTEQTAAGYVFLGPVATNTPTSSTLNFPVGDNRANGLTVALSGSGTLSAVYVAVPGATTQLIFDVTGYFTPDATGATYHALTPTRLLDTRSGNGLSGAFASSVARTFQVTGRGGVPSGAIAVTGNLTVTEQTGLGYVFLGPNATNSPTSSTLNFPVGDNRANGVTVALSGTGTLSATYVGPSGSATTQLIFDVTGYFTPDATGAAYVPLSPARVLDTRYGTGLSGSFTSSVARTFQVTGRGGVPASAIAVTGNLTVTLQTAAGYVFLGPVATNTPTSSTLNFPVGDNRANGLTVALGGGGTLSATYVGATGATTELIFDVTGYFTP